MKTKNVLVVLFLTFLFNGYAQWTRINNSPPLGSRIYFYNAQIGFLIKQNNIFKTTDGGTTWNNVLHNLNQYENIEDISFVDQNTGFISTKSYYTFLYPVSIYKTVDGGLTWNILLGPFDTGNLNFKLVNQNDWYFHLSVGWSSLAADTIYHTTNAGLNWTKLGNSTTVLYNQTINNLVLYKDSVTQSLTNLFYKSTDGGATWNLLLTDNNTTSAFKDYQFLNNNDGYVLLYQYNSTSTVTSKIYKTANGGQSWVSYNLPSSCAGPQNVYFANLNTGYIMSNNGNQQNSEIYKTTDGGQTWAVDFLSYTGEFLGNLPAGYSNNSSPTGMWEFFGKLYVLGNDVITENLTSAPTVIKNVEKNNVSFKLFPNPTSGIISIKSEIIDRILESSAADTHIEVLNTLAQTVTIQTINNEQEIINLERCPTGVYFVKIIRKGIVIDTQKIIKE